MSDETTTIPGIDDWQHWAMVMARANQMIMEAWADNLSTGKTMPGFGLPVAGANADPMAWMSAGAEAWSKGLEAWSQMLGQYSEAAETKDRRFSSPEWRENPQPGQGRIFEFQADGAVITFSILGGESGGLAANIDRSYISQLENNRKSPTVDLLFRICDALGVSAADLIARVEKTRKPQRKKK